MEVRVTQKDLPRFSQTISSFLLQQPFFILCLKGDVGAGKTTFVRHLLYSLGLSREEQVISPTYTYLNEYQIKGIWYAHIDLYRTPGIDLTSELEYRDYRGIIVEWPSEHFLSEATHILQIEVIADDVRLFRLES